jgi:hypothetical protein
MLRRQMFGNLKYFFIENKSFELFSIDIVFHLNSGFCGKLLPCRKVKFLRHLASYLNIT